MQLGSYANGSKQWEEFLNAVPDELMARASICRYKPGSTICLGEAPVRYIHLVLAGTVSAQNVTVTGKVSNWLHMPSPTFIGDLEVLAERRCYATNVATAGGCVLARWPVEQFTEAMMEYPKLLLLFSRVLAKKNYGLSVSRGHAVFRSNLEKTAIYLLQYCEAAPHMSGSQYVIQKTRTEISSEAFFSLKTLERCLYRLREAGLLSISKGKVYISEEQLRLLEKFRDDPDSI